MDQLYRTWYVCVNTEHCPDVFHLFLVVDQLVRDRDAELEHLQLGVTRTLDVPVHINLVVEFLLVLNDEAFKGCVLINF